MTPDTSTSTREIVALVYELLDAHHDTAELVCQPRLDCSDIRWRGHLDYLRALQRKGRETLAQIEAHQ